MNKTHTSGPSFFGRLLSNSRFWILAIAVTASVNIIGVIQLNIPAGSLQMIRIEQAFGFVSLVLLYSAIIISPLTKVFKRLPGKEQILHARRAIGVSACYFAVLHVCITFFGQLDGFAGIRYLNQTYSVSLLLGVFTLGILMVMTATSLDWAVKKMGFKHWKLLHRLVYLASLALLGHVLLIGPHFDNGFTVTGVITYAAVLFLIVLEMLRIRQNLREKKEKRA